MIVVAGYAAAPAPRNSAGELRTFAALERDDISVITDMVKDAARDNRALLAIYPSWDAEPSLRRLQIARAAVDRTRLVTYASDLPPLSGAVLASIAAAIEPAFNGAAMLHAALPHIERELLTVAHLRRLGGLEDPDPGLAAHATSMLPWTQFVVTSWPKPIVHRLERPDHVPDLPELAAGRYRLVFASQSMDRTWLRGRFNPALGKPEVVEVEPPRHFKARWGRGPAIEAVAHPADLAAMTTRVAAKLRPLLCPWCGATVAAMRCPLCELVTSPEPASLSPTATAALMPASADPQETL